jgi:DNA-binding HxlR family transcriptional regulator
MLGNDYEGQDCGLARALEVVGERWTMLILRDAFYGVQRFSDFAVHLDIPRAVLTDRLRALVERGLLERLPDPDHAGRALYRPTAEGRTLWPALHALMRWGTEQFGDGHAARYHRHTVCGTDLRSGAYCPVCDTTVPLEEVESERVPTEASRTDPVSVALRGPRRMLAPLTGAETLEAAGRA